MGENLPNAYPNLGNSDSEIINRVLTPEEEQALVKWSQQMDAWGWAPRCSQLHSMGAEMLKLRTGSEELGAGWAYKFLERHPQLKPIFAQVSNKDKASSQDKEKMIACFKDFASASQTPLPPGPMNHINLESTAILSPGRHR